MNDVLRLVGGGLLALVACYVGVLVKRRYKNRVAFFKSACEFLSCASTELGMKKTPMPQIAQKFLQSRDGSFERTIAKWMDVARGGKIFDFECVEAPELKTEEKKQIASFFSSLGKTDLNDQLSLVAYYKNVFEQKRKTCEEESKKLGNMYFKLCALLGLALMLVLA